MKIGCSLPYALFTDPAENEAYLALLENGGGRIDTLLDGIRRAGGESVELRSVGTQANANDVLEAYKKCRSAGLSITVHGSIPYDRQDKAAFFSPYKKLLEEIDQVRLTITLHALAHAVKTAETLDFLVDSATANDYPVFFVLENSRKKRPGNAADSCEGVCKILKLAANKDIGICWDFGHYYYNLTHYTANPNSIPSDEFLSKVRHTHIHSIYNEKTHYPLGIGDIPLCSFCNALIDKNYKGILNLELDFPRFYKDFNPYVHMIESIEILKEVVSHE